MSASTTANVVRLEPEGYILAALVGDQDYRSIEAVSKAAQEIAGQLKYQGKPILGLVDYSQERGFNTGSNKAALQALEAIPYQRAALVGSNPILTEVGRALIAALGKSANTKVFTTREEAVAWLLIKDPLAG